MNLLPKTVITGILSVVVGAGLAFPQAQRIDDLLKQLDQTTTFSDPSISPDGEWILWTQDRPNVEPERMLLHRTEASKQPTRIEIPGGSCETADCRGFAWSRDSKRLAFFADAGSGTQVYVLEVSQGKYTKIADLKGYVRNLGWSPDDKTVAFLYAEGGGGGGPLEAEPAAVGEIGGEIHNQRLTILDVKGGLPRPITRANLNIYEFDWRPDGKEFAVTAAPGPADNNWWIAKLYRANAASGEMKLVFTPKVEQQIALPKWSPDGKTIAFIGGLMSDEGFTGGDVMTIPASGGAEKNITAGARMSATSIQWLGSESMLLSEDVDGGSAIATLYLNGGDTKTLLQGPNNLHAEGNYPNLAFSTDGSTAVAIESTWEHAPEVWAGKPGGWKQVTHANASQQVSWGTAKNVHWTNGGFDVQGWLLAPVNFNPSKRYPMVVEVHGGPANQRSSAWPSSNYDMSVLSAMGYFVFFPNPRGSYGQGEAFTRANVKDFGGGDLKDILAGVDKVIAENPVDANRIGITGWSYGGYMTMWTVTQTNRFRAAVAGAGIADWLSYYGENSIDEWMIPYFGASVYDDRAVYAKSSPIEYIKNVKTPTLVIVGERDGECPAPQSFEFWHALDTMHVPTKLVVYAGEGHGFHEQKDKLDRMRRTLAWFDQYLSAK